MNNLEFKKLKSDLHLISLLLYSIVLENSHPEWIKKNPQNILEKLNEIIERNKE